MGMLYRRLNDNKAVEKSFLSPRLLFAVFVTNLVLILVQCIPTANGQDLVPEPVADEFDFDPLPGIQHDFKAFVGGSAEECFFQTVREGSNYYVKMEVLRGQDRKVDFYVRDHTGNTLHSELAVQESSFHLPQAAAGTYIVCIDNVYSRFGEKLVYIYLSSFHDSQWQSYIHEIQEMQDLAQNFTQHLANVEDSVRAMLRDQARKRFRMMQDMYLARGNRHYVSVWSLLQCVVIVISAVVQVYFVRRLFRTSAVTPTTAKPRA